MNLNQYMKFTRETAIYPPDWGVIYCALGLSNEVGEVLGKLKKEVRDKKDYSDDIFKEMGDVLWYWVRLCDDLGIDPEEVMDYNVEKLSSRKERGVISGDGDNR